MGAKQSSSSGLDSKNASPQKSTRPGLDSKTASPRKGARPTHEFLSEGELNAAKTTWTHLQATQNMQALGVRTFLRIFELEPRTKDAFEAFRGLDSDELTNNVLFRSHATRFMKAVEVTMNNLDALDVIIIPNLKHLGRRHTDFPGFHLEYLRAFEVAMEEIWTDVLGSEYSGDCRLAWRKIFGLITSKVMEGYHEALADGRQSATPSRKPVSVAREEGSGGGGGEGHQPPSINRDGEKPHRSDASATNGLDASMAYETTTTTENGEKRTER